MTVALLIAAVVGLGVWVRTLTAQAAALRERLKALEIELRRAQLAASANIEHREPADVVETLNNGTF